MFYYNYKLSYLGTCILLLTQKAVGAHTQNI